MKKNILEILLILLIPILLKDIGIIVVSTYFLINIIKGKDEWLFKSLFYLFILRFINNVLLESSIVLISVSWVFLFLIFFKLIFNSKKEDFKGLFPFVLFILSCLFSSIFKSEYLAISLFKLVSFFIGFLVVFLSIKKNNINKLLAFIFSCWLIILLLSIPTLFISFIGFSRNETGFQGITNQPNFYGPFNALLGGTLLIINQFKQYVPIRKSVFYSLLFINTIFVFISESRTALILLVFLSIVTLFNLRQYFKITFNKVSIIVILGLSSFLFTIVKFDTVSNRVVNFLAKDRSLSSTSVSFERFTKSRQGLVDVSLQNFNENPILGIGFGAPNEYYEFEVKYLPNTSIPISASIEKGNFISQMLEEVGLFGILSFSIFIFSLLYNTLKHNKIFIGFLLGPLILNMGEATIFSANGQGVFLWTLLIIPLIIKNEKKEGLPLAV